MKVAFKPGTAVCFKGDGARATIGYRLKSYDWKIPGYLGDGFYQIDMSNGHSLIAHEDDLILAEENIS